MASANATHPEWALLETLPVPSLSRPFGVHLWPHFSKAYEMLTDSSTADFKFVVGKTALSTLKETSTFVAIYYTIIFGGQELMRDRKPFKLQSLFLLHNLVLVAVSALLLALYVEELVPIITKKGIFFAICDRDGGWTQPLLVLYYLTYLTKYLELLDTVFLFLKKKPLTFLHCYHHGATAVLCYTQLLGSTPVSWVPITLNLLVHIIMYWYYFQSARGVRVWWKEWVTRVQIFQFVIDLGFIYFASYTYFVSKYFPALPKVGSCAAEDLAAFTGVAVLSSYLVLFVLFYFATYKKGKRASSTGTIPTKEDVNQSPAGQTKSRPHVTFALPEAKGAGFWTPTSWMWWRRV